MILVELELRNFKTFAGEIVKFVGKFIVVTGPNGVGKSNLVDAIAFATGARPTDLRVSKKEDLGHISAHKNFGTHVKLVLQSENGDQHSFKRFIDPSNSKYFYNDNEVSFCQYMEALKSFNLNIRTKNFLVFQNSIESIIMMEPIERTAMFEEASRSCEFKAEYDRLKAEMLRLEDELRGFLTLKRTINRSIKSTQQYKEEAKIYAKLSEQKETARMRLLLFDLYYSRRVMENLISEEQKLKETKDNLEKEQCKSEKTLRQMLNERRARAGTIAHLEKTRESLEPEIRRMKNILIEQRSKKEHIEKRVRACEKSYASAKKANAIRESNLRDLQNALAEVQREKDKYIKEYSDTLGRDVQISDSQVEEYENLKLRVGTACANNSQRLPGLRREYNALKDAYDNETRKLDEAEVRVKLKRGLKDDIIARIKKLKNVLKKKLDDLETKRAAYDQSKATVEYSKEQKQDLEREISDINRELDDSDDDDSEITWKQEEIVQKLKDQFSGVLGRLGELCQPIHNRYAIAITKVFGANVDAVVVDDEKTAIECISYLKTNRIGVCTFLPLKQLKDCKPSEHLRNIREPRNVKLLFDVIKFSAPEIAPAVFYATQNTLVCETPEDASKVAFDLPKRHDCVSLDGCHYRKSGIFSGGTVELAKKAKKWDMQRRRALKQRKRILMKKIREIEKEARRESELFELAETIRAIEVYSRYTAQDESNACKELATVEKELKILEEQKKAAEENVAEAKRKMDKAFEAMRELEAANDRIEKEIFADFCRQIGTDNIQDYEKGRERYEETIKKFDEQIDRIEVQISYESHRDTKTNVERWEKNLSVIAKELATVVEDEINNVQSLLEEQAKELEIGQSKCRYLMQLDTDSEETILKLRDELATMAKEHNLLGSKLSQIQFNMRKEKARYHSLIKEAKICSFPIVANNDQTSNGSQSNESTNTESSFELRELEASQIDFSKLPEELRDLPEAEIHQVRENLEEIISEQEREMAAITDPDMRASQHLVSLKEKLAETNKKIEAHRRVIKDIRVDYNAAKSERYNRFNRFFDQVSDHIDIIYKQLTKNQAAQAYLIAANPEEPYLAGIEYSCLVPGKRFQVNDNLSGGEKAMAALPLLFAIQSVDDKQSPFQIFDEIDASFDSTNAKKVVEYMQKHKASQSIVISHKQEFVAGADSLIGITTRGVGAKTESVALTLDLGVYSERIR